MMQAYFRFVLRHRLLFCALILAITALAGYSLSKGVFASSVGKLFLGENPDYMRYIERSKIFGNNDFLIIAYEADNPVSPEILQRLESVTPKISKMRYVQNVHTLADAQAIRGEDETIVIRRYAQKVLDHPETAGSVRDKLTADDLAAGILISENGDSGAILIELNAEADVPAEIIPVLIADIRSVLIEAGFDAKSLHTIGLPSSISAVIEATRFNIQKLFPLVIVILLVTVWLMFRRLWPVAVTSVVSGIAVVWTMGFSVLLDRQISALASMIPPVVMIIAFSDVIHLCSAYLLELGQGREKDDAILASGIDVGKACVLTSATTFLGFVAMSFVPAPAFRHMGMVLGFGVAVALLIAVTLVPILFSLIPRPKPWRKGTTGRVQDLLDRFLETVAGVSSKHPWAIIALFGLIGAVSVYGTFQMKIETDFNERLAKDHPVQIDARYFQKRYSGANMIELYITAPKKDGLLDPELFAKIDKAQKAVEAFPEVSRGYSLVNLIQSIHDVFAEDKQGELPTTRAALAQYLLLFEMAGGEDLNQLVDFNRRTMRITFRMPKEAARHTHIVGDRARETAQAIIGDQAEVETTGMVYFMGRWLTHILAGQRRGLIFAFVTIAIMMIIGLRSISVGLWSMLPNALPLAVLGGYLGLFWDQVDSDALGIMMIAIGIGVDDTIHFLMRYRIESARQDNVADAVSRTLYFSGRGIVITSVILVCGFAPLYISDYLSIKIVGSLLPLTLIAALAADLFLVPALVCVGAIRFPSD